MQSNAKHLVTLFILTFGLSFTIPSIANNAITADEIKAIQYLLKTQPPSTISTTTPSTKKALQPKPQKNQILNF